MVPVSVAAQDWVLNLDDSGFDPISSTGTIGYTTRVSNAVASGPGVATPPTSLEFDIPSGATLTGITGDFAGCAATPVVGPATVSCPVGSLPVGASEEGDFEVRPTTSAPNIAVTARLPGSGPPVLSRTEATTITAGADMSLAVTGPPTAASGSVVSYTFTSTNNGPDSLTGAELQFPVPTGLANIVPPPGCSLAASTFTCTIPGPIAPGASVDLVVDGQISSASGSTVTPLASIVNVAPEDLATDNNTASTTTSVTGGSDLRIDKARTPGGPILTGDSATFVLTPGYTGDNPTGITVSDTIPSNYAIDSVTQTGGWVCSTLGQVVTCDLPSGTGAGANVSLGEIRIDVTAVLAGGPGDTVNTATISAAGPADPNPGNNSDTDGGATITDPFVALQANKTGPQPPLVVSGNSYEFDLSITNTGNAPFTGRLQIIDDLPAGLEVTGYQLNGWTCVPAATVPSPVVGPATITCERTYTSGSPLAAGATTPAVVLEALVTLPVPPGAGPPFPPPQDIDNDATARAPDDPGIADDSTTLTVTSSVGGISADISVNKTALPTVPANVPAGEVQTFEIEVVNAGPEVATNIDLVDELRNLINNGGPAATGAGLVSISEAANAATGLTCGSAPLGGRGRTLGCSIGSLPICTPGADCPVVTVAIRPGGEGGLRTNTATAFSSDVADPNTANNEGSDTYAVDPRADVTISKVGSPDPATAGQNVTYVITAQNLNNGLSSAVNVRTLDALPDNVTFLGVTPGAGSTSCTPSLSPGQTTSGDTVACTFGTLGQGVTQTVEVLVRPNTVTRGTTLVNTVDVTTDTTETDGTNNQAVESIFVENPQIDLLINKVDTLDPVATDQATSYTIEIRNLGPSAAENVTFTDTLPSAGLRYISTVLPADGSCATEPASGTIGGSLVCSFPVLAAGDVRTVTVNMEGAAKGSYTNVVTVTSDEIAINPSFETNAANNTADEITDVRTRVDLEVVSKAPTPAATFNLREDFDFAVTVRNNTGPGRDEADDVLVTDSLPAGMELTGTPTVLVTSGSATASTCTGTAGATTFTCDLGTFSLGAVAEITVPVQVVSVLSDPQVLTNTATISTSSLDEVGANNSNSGAVTIGSSSISGTVFRDFADDQAISPGDTGIGGVTVRLTGTSFDGQPVSRTVTTAPDGTYSFDFIPQGTYTITRDPVGEVYLRDGTATPGPNGGTGVGGTEINSISVAANSDNPGYLLPLIPDARIGIAKDLIAGPTTAADGSFTATFRLAVENFSLEPLINVAVTDPLAGAAPLFGSFTSTATPATDPLPPGSYTIVAAPAGTCGAANAGFDGAGAQTVASGFTLAAGATCTVDFSVRVQPTAPLPPLLGSGGRYENQAAVTGEGQLSGQTQATNPQLGDSSDNGANPDPDGDGQANEAGENDPTPVAPVYAPSVALQKFADVGALSSPPVAGEIVTYSFTVTNTGNVTLTNLTVADPLPGLSLAGGPIASLAPGASDSVTITGTYPLTQPDVDAGIVTNQATVSGTDPFGGTATDLSGTTTGDDAPLVTPLTPGPAIALVKTATPAFSSPPAPGDTIAYAFEVSNTGNVTLSGITLSDPLSGIVLSGGPIATLAPGASDDTTFTATYTVTQADIDAGVVTNQATATGTPPAGPDVSDLSGTTAGDDLPTDTGIAQAASIDLVKSVDATDFLDGPQPGDELRYSFTVTNTGNVTLAPVTVSDPLPGLVLSGGPIASLAPGATDTTTYTATYTPTPADIATGGVTNTASAAGTYGAGGSLSVTDDSTVDANVVSIEAVPEVFPPFATDGGTTTSMLASDTAGGGPARIYPGGPPTPQDVVITVISADPGVTLDPTTGLITLAPGFPAGDHTVTYEICSALVPTVCDTTTETVNQLPLPGIEVTKTQTLIDNGDGIDGVGDVLEYVITVENTGNTPLGDVTVTDTLTSLAGAPLALDSGPDFVSSSAGSPEGTLALGETATYEARFTLSVAAVADGGTSNSVLGETLPTFAPDVLGTPTQVDDISDDGNDADGNTEDDPTVFEVTPTIPASGLIVEKTTPRGMVERGSTVPYTITVTNENVTVASPIDLVDALPAGFLYVDGSGTLDGVPVPVTVAGRIVTWEDIAVPPLSSVTATLSAFVTTGADPGEHVNRASVRDPSTGAPLAPVATAVVRILPEAVFDCGDVIGKVFDDRNADGYQNDAGPPPIIDDDAFFGGKGGKTAPAVLAEDWGEPGIPDVRLAGVDGTIITTDRFGRFHVPCAMLPEDRGSNFILKVDTRSLPAGYRLTTENPRVVRLTPGKMTEMNFGATLTPVVRIDLNDSAFRDGAPVAALEVGIDTLLPRIADTPVNLRLAYHLTGDADAGPARAHMRSLERLIRDKWRDVGQVKLTVEHTIVRIGE